MEKKHTERESLLELVVHLDKYERCKNCYHLSSCDAWVRNAKTLYDDYTYSVENCPYYVPTADVVEVRHGEWVDVYGKKFNNQLYKCSVCGEKAPYRQTVNELGNVYYKQELTLGCPYCLAKMDGGNKDG